VTNKTVLSNQQLRDMISQHHLHLLAVAGAIVGDAECEEIVQQAWIKAYQNWANFRHHSSERTWLTRIVINQAKMHLRSRKRDRRHVATLIIAEGDEPLQARFHSNGHWQQPLAQWCEAGPEQLLMRDQLADCLTRLLARLPRQQRDLLALRDHAQLGFEEICNELGLSASNARVLLHRARAQVVALVDHYEESGEC